MRKATLAVAAAAVIAAGCSTLKDVSLNPLNWIGRGPPPPPAPLAEIAKPIPIRPLWQANVGKAGTGAFAPAVAGDAVYAAAEDGTIARFDAASGKQAWRINLKRTLVGGVGADERLAVVTSEDGEVIALEPDGRERWRARVTSEVLAPAVVDSDLVVVRTTDSRIFALDPLDGRRRWVHQRAAPPLTIRTATGLAMRNGYIFGGFSGGKLIAVAASNGGLRWEGTVAIPKGTTEIERVSDVVGLPWIGEREACAAAYQGRVACFDLTKGQQLWARPVSSAAGIGVDARYVYISEDVGAVSALDRTSGNSLWRQDKLTNRVLSAPLPLGQEIVVGDVQGYAHVLSRENGAFVGRVATDGSQIAAPPVALGRDSFLVQTRNGGLYAFSLR